MTAIDRNVPVMVTGATGYVAGLLVKKLLEEGFTVHAPVRDPHSTEKLKYLNAIAEKSTGEIKYFKANLLKEGSYDEAMSGCELVFHTASPFKLEVKDPQKDLIEPALYGTRNVLETANRTPSVKRIVLTSSCAAIYSDNIDLESTPKGIFTEAMWNTGSSLNQNPYAYSKTLAEKEAWKINEVQSQWDLVVINPSLVIGPGINPYATSESFHLITQMGDGTLKAGVPKFGLGVVDVRDVAEAHYQAAFTEGAAGRYIISAYNTDMLAMAQTLLPKYGKDYPIPKKALPKWLLWLIGPIVNKSFSRETITKNVNLPWRADNSKSIEQLHIQYRPMSTSMNEFFQQLIESGQLKNR